MGRKPRRTSTRRWAEKTYCRSATFCFAHEELLMADLRVNFAGIQSPNPYWLASGPPTNTYVQVAKAFDLGWGGAVWKTVGEPILNVFSRYGSIDLGPTRMV